MSIPTLSYGCTKCDYARWELVIWGHRYYQVGENKFSVDVAMGWCHQCADLSAIEVLPSQERIAALDALVSERRAEFGKRKAEHNRTLRWWQWATQPPFEILGIKFEYERLEKRLAEMKTTLAALSERESGSRCLLCGSQDHILIPPCQREDEKPTPVGLKHPGCGGELTIGCDGTRFNIKPRHIAYDIEGNKLSEG